MSREIGFPVKISAVYMPILPIIHERSADRREFYRFSIGLGDLPHHLNAGTALRQFDCEWLQKPVNRLSAGFGMRRASVGKVQARIGACGPTCAAHAGFIQEFFSGAGGKTRPAPKAAADMERPGNGSGTRAPPLPPRPRAGRRSRGRPPGNYLTRRG